MKDICPICNKEFELTKNQKYNLKYGRVKCVYCSKECRAKSVSKRFSKEYPSTTCPICNKEYKFESKQKAWDYFNKPSEYKACCSSECKKEYIRIRRDKAKTKNKEKLKEYNKVYRKKYYNENKDKYKKWQAQYKEANKEEIRKKKAQYREENRGEIRKKEAQFYKDNKERINKQRSLKCNKDFSAYQNGYDNLSKSEKARFINSRITAIPKAKKSQFGERTSKRKGVCITNIKGQQYYKAYLSVGSKVYAKYFKTESEAIAYRIYLENTYYTPEQLAIRDKYNTIDY